MFWPGNGIFFFLPLTTLPVLDSTFGQLPSFVKVKVSHSVSQASFFFLILRSITIVFHKALTSGSTTEECACANVNNSKDLQFQIKNELQTNNDFSQSMHKHRINDLKKPDCLHLSTFTSGKGCNKEYVTMALTKRNLRTNNNKELLRKKIQKKMFCLYFFICEAYSLLLFTDFSHSTLSVFLLLLHGR